MNEEGKWTELDLTYSTVVGLHAEIAALKAENYELKRVIEALPTCQMVEDLEAERDELKASLSHERAKFYNERDRLRAALDGAYDALENNDEAGAFLILKEARRALFGGRNFVKPYWPTNK